MPRDPPQNLENMVNKGEFPPSVKIGKKVCWSEVAVRKWPAFCGTGGVAAVRRPHSRKIMVPAGERLGGWRPGFIDETSAPRYVRLDA